MHFSNRVLSVSIGLVVGLSLLAGSAQTSHADSAVAWGYNDRGQLGDGSTINRNAPVAVSGLSSGVTAVAGGWQHSLAIQNGAAKAWGSNIGGLLGIGANVPSNSKVPVPVSGLTSGVTAIEAGTSHGLAIQNGAAWAWGSNYHGQLGNGSNSDSNVPLAVSGLTSGVTAVAGGPFHSLAIQNGAALGWGNNASGQLGNGSNINSTVPVAVGGLTSGVTAIAAGGGHSLAIQDGAAWAWGSNYYGQLGNQSNSDSNVPVAVSGLSAGVSDVAGGTYHSLAIQNGNVYEWGWIANGDGTSVQRTSPFLVLDLPVDFTAVAGGEFSSYTLSSDGSLWVWGVNGAGQLGLGDFTGRLTPTQLFAPAGYKFTSIDAGPNSWHAVATLRALLPGDANDDGVVDSSDFGVLAANYGMTSGATFAMGDFDGDQKVTTKDFNILAGQFGAPSAALPGAVVPEPASLLALSGLMLLRRRGSTARAKS